MRTTPQPTSPVHRPSRARRLLAATGLAVGAATALGACAPPPPPAALAAPFTCRDWSAAEGWSKILTLLRYVEPTELDRVIAQEGWDGMLAKIDEECLTSPDEVIDPEYDSEAPPAP